MKSKNCPEPMSPKTRHSRKGKLIAMTVASAIAGLSFSGVAQDSAQPGGGEAVKTSEWSVTDTKLANHYLSLLMATPEYGSVLDLLWALYEKRESIPLLLEYIGGAAEADEEGTAKLLYAHLLRKNGDNDAAQERYSQVLDLQAENIHALRGAAEMAESSGKSAKAQAYYNRLIPLLPLPDRDGAEMRMRKAGLLKGLGQIDEAVELWLEVLAAFPEDIGLRAEVVGLLLEANRVEGAVQVLREMMITDDPELKVFALQELNRLYEFVGDFDGASKAAHEGMALAHFKHHIYADFFGRLVRLHERFGRLPELEKELVAQADQQAPTEQAVYGLVEFYGLTANPKEREKWLARLVELVGSNPAYRSELAYAQIENDHYEAAAKTVDQLLAGNPGDETPLPLLLLRTRIELKLNGKASAAEMLQRFVDQANPNAESLRKVLTFSRENYLDGVVESLLRGPLANEELIAKDDAPSAVRLAAFLRERGRVKQARETLEEYVAEAGDDERRRLQRLEHVAIAYGEMDMLDEALAAINEAIALAPDDLPLAVRRAEVEVAKGDIDAAVATYQSVWERTETIDDKTEIDQRLFSLLRGLSDEKFKEAPQPPPLGSSPATMAQFRRKMAGAATNPARVGGGLGFSEESAPQALLDFYQGIRKLAKQEPTVSNRYRVAWWAFRQQDHQEMYHQLSGLHDPEKPVIEAEKLMLELAEQTENTLLMARQLELLAKIDKDNELEYRQRWAEVRFNLGYEDEAVRLLQDLAKDPEASLGTLKSLAAVYQAQGRKQDQVGVWKRAYSRGNIFEKRRVIKQLTNTLLELNEPSEALKVQMDLIRQETDIVQKRKHFDSQLSLANRQYLLGELLNTYTELAQQAPFDHFYPEALAGIHREMGDMEEAFKAMKKAYYMSGEDRDLLAKLGAMAGQTSNLKAAIYYRRQLIAHNEGETDADSWKSLADMLERDLRVREADQIRLRLESKFAQDADFLKSMAEHYQRTGQGHSAARVLEELVRLRPWDATAQLELGVLRREAGDLKGALAAFEQTIDATKESALSAAERNFEYLPIIDGGWYSGIGTRPANGGLSNIVRGLQDYRYVPLDLQETLLTYYRRPHPEFHRVPRGDAFVRLRAIEEASRLTALGVGIELEQGKSELEAVQIEDARDQWVRRWDRPGEISLTERLWAFYHVGDYLRSHRMLREIMLPVNKATDQFEYLLLSLRMGQHQAVIDWLEENRDASSDDFSEVTTLPLIVAYLLLREDDASLPEQAVRELATALSASPRVLQHLVDQLAQSSRNVGAYRLAVIAAELRPGQLDMDDCYRVSKLAHRLGLNDERVAWLDRAVEVTELRSVQSFRIFSDGWVLPASYFQVAAEYFSLLENADQRQALRRRLVDVVASSPGVQADALLEVEVLLSYAEGDGEKGTRALARLVANRASGSRPRAETDSGRDLYLRDFWMRSERIVNQLALSLPDNVTAEAYHAAFQPMELLAPSGDEDADGEYEQFEIARFAWLLEGMSPPERQWQVPLFAQFLHGENSEIELIHTLESRGFYADVEPLYYRLIQDDPDDFTLVRGFFQACREAKDHPSALDLLNRYLGDELPRSPGMTNAYLIGEHAHFLEMARDTEQLTSYARAHPLQQATPANNNAAPAPGRARAPAAVPPVVVAPSPSGVVLQSARASDAALLAEVDWSGAYHVALARVHELRGEKEAALRVYQHLRQLGTIDLESRLRAVQLLIEKGDSETARSWLAGIAFDRVQPGAEADALRHFVKLTAESESRDLEKLGELARKALEYADPGLAVDVANTLHDAGLRAEAESMLLLEARKTEQAPERAKLLLDLVEMRLAAEVGDGDFATVADSVAVLLGTLTADDSSAETWLALVRKYAPRDVDGWRDGLRAIAGRRGGEQPGLVVAPDIHTDDRAPLDVALVISMLAGDAPDVAAAAEWIQPARWSTAGLELAALALTEGGNVDTDLIAPIRTAYAPLQSAPQSFAKAADLARRIRALSQLGLDRQLLALHKELELETVASGMLRRVAVDDVSTFEMRWQLPRAFADSGRPELAAALYRRYYDSIPRLTRSHTAFLEDYARFSMQREDWLAAGNVLQALFHKSLDGDPQLLVDFAFARDAGTGAALDRAMQKFFLSPGMLIEVSELAARQKSSSEETGTTDQAE